MAEKLEKKFRIYCRLESKDKQVWYTTWKHATIDGDATMQCLGKTFRKTRARTMGGWLIYEEK